MIRYHRWAITITVRGGGEGGCGDIAVMLAQMPWDPPDQNDNLTPTSQRPNTKRPPPVRRWLLRPWGDLCSRASNGFSSCPGFHSYDTLSVSDFTTLFDVNSDELRYCTSNWNIIRMQERLAGCISSLQDASNSRIIPQSKWALAPVRNVLRFSSRKYIWLFCRRHSCIQ